MESTLESVNFNFVFLGLFGLVAGYFVWRFIRSGSLTGAMLGGRIKRELGAVALEGGVLSSQTLKVHAMESQSGEAFVGLVLVSKAPLAVSMMPIKLSRSQAQELVRLLQQGSP